MLTKGEGPKGTVQLIHCVPRPIFPALHRWRDLETVKTTDLYLSLLPFFGVIRFTPDYVGPGYVLTCH